MSILPDKSYITEKSAEIFRRRGQTVCRFKDIILMHATISVSIKTCISSPFGCSSTIVTQKHLRHLFVIL